MFGFSFGELFIIALVALIVLGPERLPKVARTAGLLFGRAQKYMNDLKKDLQSEMDLEDLKKFKDDVSSSMYDMRSTFEEHARTLREPLKKMSEDFQAGQQSIREDLTKGFQSNLSESSKLDVAQESISKADPELEKSHFDSETSNHASKVS